MWDCSDSQEVGLEAAILERVRNSSLVKRSCADNITGLKLSTEAMGLPSLRGRGAVGERSVCAEGRPKGRLERTEARMQA
jgi:hypothetical protein